MVPKWRSSAARGSGRERPRDLRRLPRWVWFNGAAFAWGMLPVVLAYTVHDRGSVADPDCVFHCYTLVHTAGPGILGFVGAPALISLVLPVLLHLKGTRRSHFADRVAWSLATLSCLIGLVGMITGGLAMLPAPVLIVCAVVTAPLGPELTRADQSPRSSLPAAAREGSR
jgi:hypothetical protein